MGTGNMIVEARQARGWTQGTLAKAAKVNQANVSFAERGLGLSERSAKRLAVVLRKPAADLHTAGNSNKPKRLAAGGEA